MQVIYLGRAPRTKESLPDFLKWRRVTRRPLVFRGLTGSQRTPGFWGVTKKLGKLGLKRLLLLKNSGLVGQHRTHINAKCFHILCEEDSVPLGLVP